MASPCHSPAAGSDRDPPERLRDLTPSAKLTYLVVERAAPDALTVAQLRDRTRLAERTLRRAIAALEAADLITRQWALPDEDGLYREIALAEPVAGQP
jgi:DNA-binding MarR family transcriptional regulator